MQVVENLGMSRVLSIGFGNKKMVLMELAFPVESENVSGGSVGNGGDGNKHDICVCLMKVYS